MGAIALGGGNNNGIFNSGSSEIGIQAYNSIKFFCSTTNDDKFGTKTERMRIHSNGSASIGNTGSSSGDYSDTGDTGVFLSPSSSTGANTFAMTGDQPLTINRSDDNTNNLTMVGLRRQNSICGTIKGTNTTAQYNTSSDYRLKENVTAISDGITRLKTLKPYRFNFKTDASTTVDGFFAHEVTAVPEAITGTKDETQDILYTEEDTIPSGKKVGDVKETVPKYQGIDQSKLVPLLTAALQEAVAKIEVLETKVAALEAG